MRNAVDTQIARIKQGDRLGMKRVTVAIALSCAGLLAGCGGGSGSSSTPTVPTPAPTPAGTSNPVMVSMPMGSSLLTTDAYVPNPVTVSVGTTVTWINNDNVAHTSTSQNNVWESPNMEPGATYSRTFQSTGSFPYYCIYHPRMVGTVTVR